MQLKCANIYFKVRDNVDADSTRATVGRLPRSVMAVRVGTTETFDVCMATYGENNVNRGACRCCVPSFDPRTSAIRLSPRAILSANSHVNEAV
jgi:hypothetical protein